MKELYRLLQAGFIKPVQTTSLCETKASLQVMTVVAIKQKLIKLCIVIFSKENNLEYWKQGGIQSSRAKRPCL